MDCLHATVLHFTTCGCAAEVASAEVTSCPKCGETNDPTTECADCEAVLEAVA